MEHGTEKNVNVTDTPLKRKVPEEKKKHFRLGTILLIAFFLIYVPSLIHWIFGRNIATAIMQMDTIEESVNVEGCIIRNEQVLVSAFDGKCISEVQDGERVPAGYRVLTILKDSSIQLVEQLNKIEEEILNIQKERAENNRIFSSDIIKIDEEIQKNILKMANESNKNSLLKVEPIVEDINKLVEKKAIISGDTGAPNSYLEELKAEKNRIQAQINSGTREIVVDKPGIISYTIDDYESVLTVNAIPSLTPEILDEISKSQKPRNINNSVVYTGKPFAKLILDYHYYFVFTIDSRQFGDYKTDDYIEIRINDIDKIINGQISYISEKFDNNQIIVAVKTDENMRETAGMRKVNLDIIKSLHSGLKVPVKSLIDIDPATNMAKIVMVEANYAKIREVKIKGMNDEFAIIANPEGTTKGISLYSTYVLNPENIQEGQLIIK